jgi:hypothetical protein
MKSKQHQLKMLMSLVMTLVMIGAGQTLKAEDQEQPQGSLLNTSFEQPDQKNKEMPASWFISGMQKDVHHLQWVDDEAHTGKHCVKVTIDPAAKPSWVQWRQDSKNVKPGQKYIATVYFKTKDVEGRAGFYIHVYDAKHKMIRNVVRAIETKDTDWKKLEIKFNVPEDGVMLYAGTVLRGTGTAWFDDLEVVEDK